MDSGIVDTPAKLERLVRQLAGTAPVGVDTEFRRERTYYPILCFLQVSTSDLVACVDPLAVTDLDPLFEVLYDPGRTKVLHSARQDMELFYRLRGALPQPLFDTQVAAAFCGYGDQIGYGPLVERMFGVSLPKAHTRTDWCRRPLSDAQVRYAEDDVRYLPEMCSRLREALGERLRWFEEDDAALLDPQLYEVDPDQAWRRIGAGRDLAPAQQVILRELAAWRECTARSADLPRNWVADDRGLCELARVTPRELEQVETVVRLRREVLRDHGGSLLAAIERGRTATPERLWERPDRLDPARRELVRQIMQRVQDHAADAGISASLVTTRRDVEQLVAGARDLQLLRGWRRDFIGSELLELAGGSQSPGNT